MSSNDIRHVLFCPPPVQLVQCGASGQRQGRRPSAIHPHRCHARTYNVMNAPADILRCIFCCCCCSSWPNPFHCTITLSAVADIAPNPTHPPSHSQHHHSRWGTRTSKRIPQVKYCTHFVYGSARAVHDVITIIIMMMMSNIAQLSPRAHTASQPASRNLTARHNAARYIIKEKLLFPVHGLHEISRDAASQHY